MPLVQAMSGTDAAITLDPVLATDALNRKHRAAIAAHRGIEVVQLFGPEDGVVLFQLRLDVGRVPVPRGCLFGSRYAEAFDQGEDGVGSTEIQVEAVEPCCIIEIPLHTWSQCLPLQAAQAGMNCEPCP